MKALVARASGLNAEPGVFEQQRENDPRVLVIVYHEDSGCCRLIGLLAIQ